MSQNGADKVDKLDAELVRAGAQVAKILGECRHAEAVRICSACVAALMSVSTQRDKRMVEKLQTLREGITRPAEALHRLTSTECAAEMRKHAHHLAETLPAGTLFCLVAFTAEPNSQGHDTQYVSNAERTGIVTALRELADRLEL